MSSPSFLRSLRPQQFAIRLTLLTVLISLLLLFLHQHYPLFLTCSYHRTLPYYHIPNSRWNTKVTLSNKISAYGLLFIIPRSDGLSNQRITIAQALHCATLKKRIAVLPPIFANTRYSAAVQGPFHFADYFDVDKLRSLNIPFATHDAIDHECVICGSKKDVRSRVIRPLGRNTFIASLKEMKNCSCVTQAICTGLNWTSEFGVYSDYTTGQGFKVTGSKTFRSIRAAIQPSREVRNLAQLMQRRLPISYNAVHIRRTDFRSKCSFPSINCTRFGRGSVNPSPEFIVDKVLRMPRRPLFVATEDPDWAHEQLRPRLRQHGINVVLGDDTKSCWQKRVDIKAMAEQVVCVGAKQFLGNRFSSFSADILQARVLENRTTEKEQEYLR